MKSRRGAGSVAHLVAWAVGVLIAVLIVIPPLVHHAWRLAVAAPKVPNTISDEQMDSLRRRADKANPELRKFTSPEAVRRRKQSGEQLKKSSQS